MNVSEQLQALNDFDLADLDMDNIGRWPLVLKVIVLTLLYVLILVAGFYLHVEDLNKQLGGVEQEEQTLRQDFEKKAFEAANLEAYKAQLVEMEQRFGALVAQLPSETEVPGLLEDITDKGELNGLSIKRIDLLDEQAQTFYVELPIAIEAVGSYHDLGAFISGMAGLPRIVTLHDFEITIDNDGRAHSGDEHSRKNLSLSGGRRWRVGRPSALLRHAGVVALLPWLASCADSGFSDLDAFMEEKRARPGGVIEPIPTFRAYEAFAYAATTSRSPFDRPVDIRQLAALSSRAALRPDTNRPKEYLERFTLDSLMMVGSLERSGEDWTLIQDPDGGIHRVQVNHFLGRDHGRIVEMGATFVAVIEIVPDGTEGGWVERPRTIELSGM